MDEAYGQAEVDRLAQRLRDQAAIYCDLFKVAHGLETDPDLMEFYLDSDFSYQDFEPELTELIDTAQETLPDSFQTDRREEQLYRRMKKYGEVPEVPAGADWREIHSEGEIVDNERNPSAGVDYGPLIRTWNDVMTFIMAASEIKQDVSKMLPEIQDDDSEIIENTKFTEVQKKTSPPVAGTELSPEEETRAYNFLGWNSVRTEEPKTDK